MLTKDQIIKLLETNDRAIGRALLVLLSNQTLDEQTSETVKYHNGKGFRPCHGRVGTSMANFFQRRRLLEMFASEYIHYDKPEAEVIYVYDSWSDRLVMQYADQCTVNSVYAYRYLKNIVTKISSIFGHVPPAVGIHSSKVQAAFYVDHDRLDPTIVLSIEELMQHPVGAIWTALHEYMHYVQRFVCNYLEPLRGNIFYRECRWKGSTVRIDMMETPHHKLPWEAEADSFANANIGFFLNEFGYAPDQFENPLPGSDPESVKIRVQPNFNVERKQPEFWYYNSENSGCL